MLKMPELLDFSKERFTQGVAPAQGKKSGTISKALRDDPFKPFNIQHRGIGICTAGFKSHFGIVFGIPPFLPFGNGNRMSEVCSLLSVLWEGVTIRDYIESQKRL